jgi:hypothetical protein
VPSEINRVVSPVNLEHALERFILHVIGMGVGMSNSERNSGRAGCAQETVVCLTYLRSAGAALSSAIEARAPLADEMRVELFEINRRVNAITTKLWDTLSTEE